ncbi:shikimate kinase [Persephonella sp.]
MKKNIYLVGFMGSGKSTVGKIIAKKIDFKFVDVDEEIQNMEKMPVSQIFKDKGEDYFRELEKKMIDIFIKKDKYVVSTGGGLGANYENMKKMKSNGVVIWLDVPFETAVERVSGDKNRPLLNLNFDDLKKLYIERKNVYSLADLKIETDGKSPEDVADEILKVLGELK